MPLVWKDEACLCTTALEVFKFEASAVKQHNLIDYAQSQTGTLLPCGRASERKETVLYLLNCILRDSGAYVYY